MTRGDVTFDPDGVPVAAWFFSGCDDGRPAPCVVMGHGLSLTRGDGLRRAPAFLRRVLVPAPA